MSDLQINRIRNMESLLRDAREALDDLEEALTRYEDTKGKIRRLEAYYTSPLWMQDFEADEHGELPEDMPDTGKSLEQAAADRDSSFRIHMALHALEEPYREVFELRIFGELSFREIGMIFQKTENWARVTYHRAKLKLRERMGET